MCEANEFGIDQLGAFCYTTTVPGGCICSGVAEEIQETKLWTLQISPKGSKEFLYRGYTANFSSSKASAGFSTQWMLLGSMWDDYAKLENSHPGKILVATLRMVSERITWEWLLS